MTKARLIAGLFRGSRKYTNPEACLFRSPQPAARVRPLPDLWSLRFIFRRCAPYDPCGSGSGLTTNWVNRSGPRDSILPSVVSCSPRPTARYRSLRPLRIRAVLGVVVGFREVRFAADFTCQISLAMFGLADRTSSPIASAKPDCLRLSGPSQRARREDSSQLAG